MKKKPALLFARRASYLCSMLERKPRKECREAIRYVKQRALHLSEYNAKRWIEEHPTTRTTLAKYGILLKFKTFSDDGSNLSPIGDDWYPVPHVWVDLHTQAEQYKRYQARQQAKKKCKKNIKKI